MVFGGLGTETVRGIKASDLVDAPGTVSVPAARILVSLTTLIKC